MSRIDLPLGLLDRIFGPPGPRRPDDAMVDRIERALHDSEPDPLFRRRLRTSVLNEFVAIREGHLRRVRPRRRMGSLGRAVLYSSLTLAISATAVGAAAQEALPGDALYGIKVRLEEVRMQIAPPSVHAVLATLALEERVEELEKLAAAGQWDAVTAAAERVARAEAALVALDPHAGDHSAAAHAGEVLSAVLADAPDAARPGLEKALSVVGAPAADPPIKGASSGSQGSSQGSTRGSSQGAGTQGSGSQDSDVPSEPDPKDQDQDARKPSDKPTPSPPAGTETGEDDGSADASTTPGSQGESPSQNGNVRASGVPQPSGGTGRRPN